MLQQRPPKKIWKKILLVFFIIPLLLFGYALGIEPYWIKTTHHTLHVDVSLPKAIKIAHLSDLHTQGLGRREKKLLALLEQEKPDVIVITGDTMNGETKPQELFDVLSQLHAPLGVFAVPGNWDRSFGDNAELEIYQKAGVHLLKNETFPLFEKIQLLGLNASWDPTLLQQTLSQLSDHSFCIALFHEPILFDSVTTKCKLAFSGHTHGGQVRLPFLPPFWLPPKSGSYVAGWYQKAQSHMYVSQGIGTSLFPIRFFCRPELAIITISYKGLQNESAKP